MQRQRAFAHPLRARILAALEDGERSPVELARDLGASLGVASYHVRVLAEAGLVELARTTPRRGAIQHHYRLAAAAGTAARIALTAERAARLVRDLRDVVERARREAAGEGGDVELTVLVHHGALP